MAAAADTLAPRPARPTGRHAPLAALIAGALAIAFAPILVRLGETGPVAAGFHRLFLAIPFLWLAARAPADVVSKAPGSDALLMAAAGILLACDLAILHLSIGLTSVANATLFNNSAPLFVALFAWFFLGERIAAGYVLALALCGGGVFLLMGEGLTLGGPQLVGDAMALSTGMFYGGYILLMKMLRARHGTARLMLASSAAALPVLFGAAMALGEPMLPVTAGGWGVLLALGLVCHVCGQSLIAYALAHLPATFSSLGLLLQPIGAALMAWGLFGESLGPRDAAGVALVLGGILLARRATV